MYHALTNIGTSSGSITYYISLFVVHNMYSLNLYIYNIMSEYVHFAIGIISKAVK